VKGIRNEKKDRKILKWRIKNEKRARERSLVKEKEKFRQQ
jgi:hypothetical protein